MGLGEPDSGLLKNHESPISLSTAIEVPKLARIFFENSRKSSRLSSLSKPDVKSPGQILAYCNIISG